MSNNPLNETSSKVLATNSIINHPSPATDLHGYSQFGSTIGMVLFGIISVILLLAWLAKRVGWKRHSGNLLDVKASYMITPKERIMLVHVDHQLLVVGVTSHQMTLLHTISEERTHLLLSQTTNAKSGFKNSLFHQILQTTLKNRKG